MKVSTFARALVTFCLLVTQTIPTHSQTTRRRASRRNIVMAAQPQPQAYEDPIPTRAASAQTLPLRRVILYSNGVAYFERRGTVRGNAEVELAFKQSQVDDVLKSMVVLDIGQGRIGTVSYNSSQPPQARLADIPFSIEAGTQNSAAGGLAGILRQLQGARVAVATATRNATGNILTVEGRTAQLEANKPPVTTQHLVIASANGEIADFDLSDVRSVRLLDDEAQRDIREFANASAAARRRDAKTIVVTSDGEGSREMLVSYTVAAPIWKTTYRVVLDTQGQPFFQGWAIVDNVGEEDWTNVRLSLVSGTPISFIQPIQQPFYRYRPVVPMPENLNLEPQTYEPELGARTELTASARNSTVVGNGSATISGRVMDANGAVIPGATITARNQATGYSPTAISDDEGEFTLSGVPPGTYTFMVGAPGFRMHQMEGLRLNAGGNFNQTVALEAGAIAETVSVTAANAEDVPENGRRFSYGVHPPAPKIGEAITSGDSGISTAAKGGEVGDLFEYRIDQPVTVKRDRSALIPILQTRMSGERVSIYNEAVRADRPLGGLLLKNTSSLTLEGGALTVIDGDAYAGEALMERLKPNEDRLISFALDLGTLIAARTEQDREPVFLVKASNGVLQAYYYRTERKTYTVTNQTDKPRTIYIERPIRQGWELKTDATTKVERTPSTYRFRVELPANQTVKLPVTERQALMDTFALTNFTSQDLQLLVARRYVDDATRARLAQIVELKSRIAALDAQSSALEREATEIGTDQARLRENIKALGDNSEARALIARYVEKASTQETRLEALTGRRREIEQQRAQLQAELDTLIRNFTVEQRF